MVAGGRGRPGSFGVLLCVRVLEFASCPPPEALEVEPFHEVKEYTRGAIVEAVEVSNRFMSHVDDYKGPVSDGGDMDRDYEHVMVKGVASPCSNPLVVDASLCHRVCIPDELCVEGYLQHGIPRKRRPPLLLFRVRLPSASGV